MKQEKQELSMQNTSLDYIELDNAPCGLPLSHKFSDSVYAREIFMPEGSFVIGYKHKTKHLNIVQTGSALVYDGNSFYKVTAPFTFESEAGVRKALYILKDMIWTTIHPTNETDMDKLEDLLIDKKPLDKKEAKELIDNLIGCKLELEFKE